MSVYLQLCTSAAPALGDVAEFGRIALALGVDPGSSLIAGDTTGAPRALKVVVPVPVDPTEANARLLQVARELAKMIDAGRTLSPSALIPVAETALGRGAADGVLAPAGSRLRRLVVDLTMLLESDLHDAAALEALLTEHGFDPDTRTRLAAEVSE